MSFRNHENQQRSLGKILDKISQKLTLRKILREFRFCHIISYLLTGLFVQYLKILSPQFLHTDLKSSIHTSKLRALVFQIKALASGEYGEILCTDNISSRYFFGLNS